MDGITISLVCCTQVIQQEVTNGCTRKDIALTYAMALTSQSRGADRPDWAAINGAILSRYKMSGLEWIKKRAWDILARKIDPAD